MELEIVKNGKKLRCGYTTGTCATAASTAAAKMLLTGEEVPSVQVHTPAGVTLQLEIHDPMVEKNAVSCAVQKYSGDDPDITNGILIYSRVEKTEQGIDIDGGFGVGRVTLPGLDQPVGNAAINSTPRRMITEHLTKLCEECGYEGGLKVVISIPQGEELAKKTFNSRLGILGGLSVLGTSGIVEPMSNHALVESLKLEMRRYLPDCDGNLLLVPGNYGAHFAHDSLHLRDSHVVSCSNFIGEAIDGAIECGYRKLLLVGHIGKLVKLGINITNTHSAYGDGRMETLLMCGLKAGADFETLQALASAVTTDTSIRILHEKGLLEKTMQILGARIEDCLHRRAADKLEIAYVCFTNAEPCAGVLMQSDNAKEMLDYWRIEHD